VSKVAERDVERNPLMALPNDSARLPWPDLVLAKNKLDYFVLACELRFVRNPPSQAELQQMEQQINRLAAEMYVVAQNEPPLTPILFPLMRDLWAIRATLREIEGHPNAGGAFRSVWARNRSFRDARAGWDSRDPVAYAIRTLQLAIEVGDEDAQAITQKHVLRMDPANQSLEWRGWLAEALVPQWDITQQERNARILDVRGDGDGPHGDLLKTCRAYLRSVILRNKLDASTPDAMILGGDPIESWDEMVHVGVTRGTGGDARPNEQIEARLRGLDDRNRALSAMAAKRYDLESIMRGLTLLEERNAERFHGVVKTFVDRFIEDRKIREIGRSKYDLMRAALRIIVGRQIAYTIASDHDQDDGHKEDPARLGVTCPELPLAVSLNPSPDVYEGIPELRDPLLEFFIVREPGLPIIKVS
jgi:hypothetical protein